MSVLDSSSEHGLLQDLENRARAGDRAAADKLLGQQRDALIGFCYRYLREIHSAEDATQDVLAKLSDPMDWPRGSLRAFLLRMARNRCLNLLRRRQDLRLGVGSVHGDSQLPSPRTGPLTAVVRQEERELLRQHLSSLPRDQAEVLMLRFFEDLSRKEMAEVLELPASVVKSRLYEGLQALQRRVGGDRGKGGGE